MVAAPRPSRRLALLLAGLGAPWLSACSSDDWCRRFNLDCVTEVPLEAEAAPDADGDVWPDAVDCDDNDPQVFPGATEVCDGVDNDCDGEIDEGTPGLVTWYLDEDYDGYGDPDLSVEACDQPELGVDNGEDCDDSRADVNPAAAERCDSIDHDCDGDPTEGATDASALFEDRDGDGYGDADAPLGTGCEAGEGESPVPGDCDDDDATMYPGADEWCDDIDSDCDGSLTDADSLDASTWYQDGDGDGYGLDYVTTTRCTRPAGYAPEGGDCDDSWTDTFPGAEECDDGKDNDCDDLIDEGEVLEPTLWTWDADDDGYAVEGHATLSRCYDPPYYADQYGDCDDSDASAYPGNTEVCDDGVDNDCNGLSDDEDPELDESTRSSWYPDADGDGHGESGAEGVEACQGPSGTVEDDEDCDDEDATTYPDAPELCGDGIIQDCDGDEIAADAQCGLEGELLAWSAPWATTMSSNHPGAIGTASTAAGDLDGDGGFELVVGAPETTGQVGRVYLFEVEGAERTTTLTAAAVISGRDAGDGFGTSLLSRMDLDGDGIDDLAVGAPSFGVSGQGSGVYVFSGPVSGMLSHDDASWYALDSTSGVSAGASLAAGDIDGDGAAELLVGAWGDDTSASNAGAVWIIATPESADPDLREANLVIYGDDGLDQAGRAVVVLGDIDGDGRDDVAVGAPGQSSNDVRSGRVGIFRMPSSNGATVSEGDTVVEGLSAYGYTGWSLAAPGDVDGDGRADLLVGSYDNAGQAFLLTDLESAEVDADDAVASFLQDNSGERLGEGLETADLDGDGEVDFLLAAPAWSESGRTLGHAYAVLGPISGTVVVATDADVTFTGMGPELTLGRPGDLDGDGADEILLGFPSDDDDPDDGGWLGVWWSGRY